MGFNRPFWQNHPDPKMRVPPHLRPGGKPTPVMTENMLGTYTPTYVCPHCGHVGRMDTGFSALKHFGYCKHKDKGTMSKEQIQEIIEERDLKKCLMNQYGDFILTQEELLKVMSTIALDKKDNRSALAIKLMYDYHDKMANKPEEAQALGFDGFVFEVLPTKQELEIAEEDRQTYKNKKRWEREAEDAKESSNIKTPK